MLAWELCIASALANGMSVCFTPPFNNCFDICFRPPLKLTLALHPLTRLVTHTPPRLTLQLPGGV